MKNCFGQHGWKEFHRNRQNILEEYQRLIDLTSNRPMQVAHGPGVEAYIRKWLSEFLPKKYGVTSGYIIPSLYKDDATLYHFDIIIYNCLEAPVLWTEGNEDNSAQGKYRAIPAKYVVSLYEVKSRLNKRNVVDALAKLRQVDGFKEQLPANYSSGIIFIELKEKDTQSANILKSLHTCKDIFGFSGGLVMRYENDQYATGRIMLYRSEDEHSEIKQQLKPLAKNIDDLNIYQTEDGRVKLTEKGGGAIIVYTGKNTWALSKVYSVEYKKDEIMVCLSWSRSNFSTFCVDLLSCLENGLPLNNQNRHFFGMVFDSLRLEKAPTQPLEARPDYPFLRVSLCDGPEGKPYIIDFQGGDASITFWVEVVNEGSAEATISDNRFVSSIVLPKEKKAVSGISVQIVCKEDGATIRELLDSQGVEIPYRLVYKAGPEGKDLFSLDKVVLVKSDGISIGEPPAQVVVERRA